MTKIDRHVSVQARCFLCDHNFHRVHKTAKIEQQLNLIASKLYQDAHHGLKPTTDTVALFTADGLVEVVRNASSHIIDFIEEITSRLTFNIRGIRHSFQRYHPYFSDQEGQTWYLDERWEENIKYCGLCIPEKSLFFAHAADHRAPRRQDPLSLHVRYANQAAHSLNGQISS